MSDAYVDTSAVLSVAFNEPGWETIASRMSDFSYLASSNLLEAEVRSAFARERRTFDPGILSNIEWVHYDRSLSPEMTQALNAGYLRGADLWHMATALYIADTPSELTFLTLDLPQRNIAANLGFQT